MIKPLTAAEVLRELVAIATPSSRSNLPLLKWVSHFLEPRGWRVQLINYDDEKGVAKANLIARPAQTIESDWIDLAFICHTDTVSFSPAWEGALKLKERAGYLHGCGACDVKGSLACFLAAVVDVRCLEIKNIALILTADEEVGCKGMDRLLASTELRIGSAIVSEPTSLRPGIAGKGYGLARITVEGREAHSAFPQRGVSAISIAARLIAQIEDSHADSMDSQSSPISKNGLFDPPRTTLNIGVIEGGTAKNIIAGSCSFLVEWRPLPGEDLAHLLSRLEQLSTEFRTHNPLAKVHVEALRSEAGFAATEPGPLQLKLCGLLNTGPTGISFGSEASRVASIADEVVVIGPGDMQTAHSERECVPLAELEHWTDALRKLLRSSPS